MSATTLAAAGGSATSVIGSVASVARGGGAGHRERGFRSENPGSWFQLLAGIAQVALGFWAAGNWTRSVVLLVAWIAASAAASAIFRGVAMIIFGFNLHALRHEFEAVEGTEARERSRQAPEPRYGH